MASDSIVSDFDASLTDAERSVVARAQEFGQRIVAPAAEEWEILRCHPTETLRAACREGLAGIELSPRFGGQGLRFSAKMRVVEELAKHDFGFAFSLVNHHNALVRISRASPQLADRLVPRMLRGEVIGCTALTEPDHGSDMAGVTTSASRTSTGWTLNGRKAWICNAAVAGVMITLAQTDPSLRSKGLAAFIVEADETGFVRETAYGLQGIHAAGIGGFRLENYLAPEEALLDPPGSGFSKSLSGINGARCYVAAMCAGMLDSAISQAASYASQRQAFGQSILEFQGLRWSLVNANTDLGALRLLAYRAAQQIDAGRGAEEAAALAKKFAGDHTLSHLAACIQVMGASGLRADLPLMRHLAACKAASFADGSTEMMNERLGKLLRKST